VFLFFTSFSFAAETQITTNSANQINPSISGNYIVWEDYRNSPPYDPIRNPDIYRYKILTENPLTGSEAPIASEGPFNSAYYIEQMYPFGGERVVWMGIPKGGTWNIYFYDFNKSFLGIRQVTALVNLSYRGSPAISGNRIVWEDERDGKGNGNIYMRTINPDGSLGAESGLITASGNQYHPRIDGNRIVWTDQRNGNYDIYFYDFDKPVTNGTQVTSDISRQTNPIISGNTIVWEDYRNENADVYMRTINPDGFLGTETRITDNSSNQINPAIYGNIIVWEDYRTGYSNIYLYNISTGIEVPLTSGDYYHKNPSIYGNKVVWAGGPDSLNNSDIYLTDIDTTLPSQPTSLFANPISSSQINLSWTASTDNVSVAGYRIYRGGSFVGTTTTTSYSDTGLSPSTPYSYQVSAYDGGGNESTKSNIANATTKNAPPTISSVTPNTGLNTGPTNITINGTNFTTIGIATAKVGTTSLSSVAVVSSTKITATVPAGLSPATYSITVTSPDGQSGSINGFIVTGPNQNPTANAGPDQTIDEGAVVNLNGMASSDPNGDSLTYSWTQTAGPLVTLNNPNTASPSFVAPQVDTNTTLTFQLTVNDGKGGTASDTVNVTVNNTTPPPPPPSDGGGGGSPPPSNDGGGGGGDPAPAAQSTPTGKIRGRIISTSGLAILGTPARINDTRMATNLNGEFEFSGLSDGIYTVYYEVDGYISQTQVLPVSGGGITNAPMIIMSLARPNGRIRGRIINTSGIPILGTPARIDASRAATTLNGEFEFTFVADGVYTLWYDAPGYITQSQVLVVINGGTTTSPTVIMSPNSVSVQSVGKGKKARRVVRRRRRR
jgi:beta propeller repeat protein